MADCPIPTSVVGRNPRVALRVTDSRSGETHVPELLSTEEGGIEQQFLVWGRSIGELLGAAGVNDYDRLPPGASLTITITKVRARRG